LQLGKIPGGNSRIIYKLFIRRSVTGMSSRFVSLDTATYTSEKDFKLERRERQTWVRIPLRVVDLVCFDFTGGDYRLENNLERQLRDPGREHKHSSFSWHLAVATDGIKNVTRAGPRGLPCTVEHMNLKIDNDTFPCWVFNAKGVLESQRAKKDLAYAMLHFENATAARATNLIGVLCPPDKLSQCVNGDEGTALLVHQGAINAVQIRKETFEDDGAKRTSFPAEISTSPFFTSKSADSPDYQVVVLTVSYSTHMVTTLKRGI